MDEAHRHFVRGIIDYFGFATALTSRLQGGPDTVRMNTIFQVWPKLEAGKGNFTGQVFQCTEMLTYFNGSYDAKDLSDLTQPQKWAPEGFVRPQEVTFETWSCNWPRGVQPRKWKKTNTTTVKGINYLKAGHTGDGGDRCCAGWVNFTYEDIVETKCNGPEIRIPASLNFPEQRLIDMLRKYT